MLKNCKRSLHVHLTGGLGNQMFQVAHGYSLAKKALCNLFFRVQELNLDRIRKYELQCFRYNFSVWDEREVVVTSLPFIRKKVCILEKQFRYHPVKIPFFFSTAELKGYWQSEKYFKAYEADIRKLFSFDESLISKKTRDYLTVVDDYKCLSVHVRRGDYLSNPKAAKIHGVCSLEYYEKSIQELSGKFEKLLVFSDDLDWCRSNLKIDGAIFVKNDNRNDWEDIYLMSKCYHNIIANSSFSWWGAWLNENPNKIVISPKNWFQDQTKDTSDLIPEEWIRL